MNHNAMNRRQLLGTMAAGAGLAAVGAPMRARAQGAPIQIGVIQTVSGPLGSIGQAHIDGLNIGVAQLNAAGGIGGRPVEIVVRDAKMSAADGVSIMREFVGSGIKLVIGEAFTSVNLATVPLLDELGVMMISPTTIDMSFTHESYTPNFFRCGPNAYMQYNGETNLMAQEFPELTRWGGVQLDTAGNHANYAMIRETLKRNYMERNGVEIEVLDPVLTKYGATDYRTAVNKLASMGLQGLITALAGPDCVTFLKQAKPFGLLEQVGAVADNNLNVGAGPALGRDIPNNFYTHCYWYPSAFEHVPMSVEFHEAYKAAKGTDVVDPYATTAHTALMGFAKGIADAGSTDPKAVSAALEGQQFDSVFGAISFRKEDHQLMLAPGYLEYAPADTEAGFEIKRYIQIPVEQAIEPANPGVPFAL